MQIQDVLQLAVVGAAVALLIQYLKNRFSLSANGIKALTVIISLIIGTGYILLRNTSAWETITEILTTASTVWAFFLKGE